MSLDGFNGFAGGETLYHNPLRSSKDVENFVMEGDGVVTFPMDRMRLESVRDPEDGQAANIVFWCPEAFPDDIVVTWKFWPIREPGLAIMFFAAKGREGQSIFDPSLAPRNGPYKQYHSGDINALHVAYFRRRWEQERAFHTCNLRKSHGFHLVDQGADPIPSVLDARPPYEIQLIKSGPDVLFGVNGLCLFHWVDDGQRFGPALEDGNIGFRQMAPLIAEYADFTVRRCIRP